jgi:thiol:disulfide interchange protein DsbD
MKKIIIIFFTLFLFFINVKANDFLKPSEAFSTTFKNEDKTLFIEIKAEKNIYLYAEKIKIKTSKNPIIEITKYNKLSKATSYKGENVYFNKLDISIPYSQLEEKGLSGEIELEVKFQGCSIKGLCYAPISKKTKVLLPSGINNINETDSIANTLKNENILLVLATFFGFGLLLSLTPCVFPMIPILSSIIVRASKNEKMTTSKGFLLSLVYVLSMSLAYTIAGIVAGVFGANLQVALQNTYVLSVFAIIFVGLAFSMFGYFEIKLPTRIQNKLNKTSDGKQNQGIIGIAIMGFLSALIVGPCVAPPLAGALVYIGQTGDAILGGLALFVMSLGMGIPLLLIGLGAGKFMPRPGGWMESVTKIFGILMLGLAIWLLERVLNPNFIMYLWAFLLIGTAIYLRIYKNILMQLLSTIIFILGVCLFIGGLSGSNNLFNPLEKFTSGKTVMSSSKINFIKIKNIKDLEEAIQNSSKPLMLDFYADWCISCKELENITFKDEAVLLKLKEFTLLKIDVTENNTEDKALQKKFDIIGPPALLFWNKDKKEIKASRIIGYKNPEEFLKILNKYF